MLTKAMEVCLRGETRDKVKENTEGKTQYPMDSPIFYIEFMNANISIFPRPSGIV